MAVCSFIGHGDVYDADMELRLQAAIEQVLSENEAVEFLLYSVLNEEFFNYCLMAALRIRSQHPGKVTITLAQFESHERRIPSCMIDRVISPKLPEQKSKDNALTYKHKLRWIIQNSSHLICCIYDKLYDSNMQALKAAGKRLKIIDISNPETEQAIMESSAVLMSEKEQIIFHAINDGSTLIEAGKLIGVSRERAKQILQQGCRTIGKGLKARCLALKKASKCRQERTCGLFALGKPTYETMLHFKFIIDFLISSFGVKDFYVEQSYVHSGFMFALTVSSYRELIHITAEIGGTLPAGDNNAPDNMERLFCPPCGAVICVGCADTRGDFGVIADMIERTDFCICDLSAADNADEIRAYAAQAERAVLLDMGEDCDCVR